MKIYVVTHKPIDILLPENYALFQVNAANNKVFCELNDAVGKDNISSKNPNYCELTAAYWIWKNDNENDIVGLMHYRRFLTTKYFSKSPKNFINGSIVEELLEKYDFISTPLCNTLPTVKDVLLKGGVRQKDFQALRDVIEKNYSEYLQIFDDVFNGKKTYICNMFITKKAKWNSYYEWLFSVFDKLEPNIDMTGYDARERRLYGYLSERLFTIYVLKNKFKVKSFPICFTEDLLIKKILRRVKNFLLGR